MYFSMVKRRSRHAVTYKVAVLNQDIVNTSARWEECGLTELDQRNFYFCCKLEFEVTVLYKPDTSVRCCRNVFRVYWRRAAHDRSLNIYKLTLCTYASWGPALYISFFS